ncbi:MAG: hypothetical protein ACUVR0_08450 [Candidatus Aminicenantales bacterium]
MEKEKIVELFNKLSPEDKFEVMKSIMPEFCQSLRKEPQRMQEMMKSMMGWWGMDMAGWMGIMGK